MQARPVGTASPSACDWKRERPHGLPTPANLCGCNRKSLHQRFMLTEIPANARISSKTRTGTKCCFSARVLAVRGVVQGVGFRPFVYRLALEEGLAGFIGNDTDGVTIEIEGPSGAGRSVSPPSRGRSSAALRASIPLPSRETLGHRRNRFPHRRQRSRRPRLHRHSRRRRHLRRLPARAARSQRPPLPLSVFELHQLRPALHHHAPHPLRPPADLDGALQDVPGLPGRVRRPR